jgi:tRNA threonylcarbamoyl adenosine modification protein YeaZ
MVVSIENKTYLALDTSYEHASVALFRGNEIIFERVLGEKFAHGKLICEAIDAALSHSETVAGLFCGLGPGSFVGARIALATALGFCFARSLPLMGFCSHEALAFSGEKPDNYSIFMKASGDLFYLTRFLAATSLAPTQVISIDELPKNLEPDTVIFSDQASRITTKFSSLFLVNTIFGPTPQGILKAAQARFKREGKFVDERAFIKPNYIKAPNVSLPKHSICQEG